MRKFLHISVRKTLFIDLKHELTKIIDFLFSQPSRIFIDDLETIHRMRNAVMNLEVTENDLEALKRYYTAFKRLSRIFPDGQLSFTWIGTLSDKCHEQTESNFNFELLNIVYNIGAMYSLLGINIKDKSLDGLNKSYQYFQNSAGCFQYIIDTLNMDNKMFDNTSLNFIKLLLLAQAQECFWFKAINNNIKNSLISRLAIQVSNLYRDSKKYAESSHIIDTQWIKHLEEKQLYFKAVAYYRHSIYCFEEQDFGSQINLLKNSLSYLQKVGNTDMTENFRQKVHETLKCAERDNDLIYLRSIPNHVPELKPAMMVKSINFEQLLVGFHLVLFKDLLPIDVIESSNALNERQEIYISDNIISPLQVLNNILKKEISKYQIFPDFKCISSNDWERFEKSFYDLEDKSKGIQEKIYRIESLLKNENQLNAEMLSKHGISKWTLPNSEDLNGTFYKVLETIKGYIAEGATVDGETKQLFSTINQDLITKHVKYFETNDPLLQEIAQVIKRRETFISQVNVRSSTNMISAKIITAYKSTATQDFETVFLNHIKIFQNDLIYVQEERELNHRLLNRAKCHFSDIRTNKSYMHNIYTDEFNTSLSILDNVRENIKEGSKFYNDLTHSVEKLLTEVQQFIKGRNEKIDQLNKKLLEVH